MEKAERETIILINQADWDEGFFRISTSIPHHCRNIQRRVKKNHILDFREERSKDKHVLGWEFKIEAKVLNQKSLGLAVPRKSLSPDQKKASRERACALLEKINKRGGLSRKPKEDK